MRNSTHPLLESYLKNQYNSDDLNNLLSALTEAGTFQFEPLATGLFPAALSHNEDYQYTGYANCWLRDNIHVAHALYATGNVAPAQKCVQALMDFYVKYAHRFDEIISGKADPADAMQRPHIRFEGTTLSENEEKWAHAQNDAMGALLWLYTRIIREQNLSPPAEHLTILPKMVEYLNTIQFWQDEDSGHWEETKKIEGSSIGIVVAGLRELNLLYESRPELVQQTGTTCTRIDILEESITLGEKALDAILPAECIQSDPEQNRRYDAALLFLIYPFDVVSPRMADQIMNDVKENLQREIGIIRYQGDSYWCADYKEKLSPEVRTADFSDDQNSRDSLLKPGEEAQWCIFDPILSVIYGKRFQNSHDLADYDQQVHYFQRSLSQLTDEDSSFGSLKCPESYYLVKGQFEPNDITPLLWTQGNLLQAIHQMKTSCEIAEQK